MNVVDSDTIPWPGGASARTAQRAAIDAQLISSRVRQNSRRASGKAPSASYSVNIDRPWVRVAADTHAGIMPEAPRPDLDGHQNRGTIDVLMERIAPGRWALSGGLGDICQRKFAPHPLTALPLVHPASICSRRRFRWKTIPTTNYIACRRPTLNRR
jgi:hypothetical protein